MSGLTRNYLAAIDSSGAVTTWNPDVTSGPGCTNPWGSCVNALVVSGSTVYAGGGFLAVGGLTRNLLAAIDTSGAVTSWDPNAIGYSVGALILSGNTVYAGGNVNSVGGLDRFGLAAIDSSGAVTSWTANLASRVSVLSLAVSAGALFVGGEFTGVSAQPASNFARVPK